MSHYSMQSIQNLGLAIVSLLAGVILDAKGYILLEVFFLALLCGALIAGVVLYMYDAAKGKWGGKMVCAYFVCDTILSV